jgi:putative flippase GtrA
MPEKMTTTATLPTPAGLPLRARMRHGVRHPHNWWQLGRFVAVGASGYVVNLGMFAMCVHLLGIDYRISAVIAYVVSVVNNFWFNRHWTFGARHDHPMFQAVRFFAVSLLTFAFTYAVLITLVDDVGLPKVVAQATAIVAGTPLSFLGQKLWSFKA